MPTFRADYLLKTSLVLPRDVPSTVMSFDGVELTLLNGVPDAEGHISGLVARVIGEAPSLRETESAMRAYLADGLDALAFITRQKFEIEKCTAVMEWEAFKTERHMLAMEQFDPNYPPLPNLHGNFVRSSEIVAGYASASDVLRLPLKYFRLGLIARQPEDQFQYFWLSFETLAEATKSKDKITIECQICKVGLECKDCGAPQTRRPVATDEMRSFIDRMGADGRTEMKKISEMRNQILHGRSHDRATGRKLIDISSQVDDMAVIAWNAIVMSLPKEKMLDVSGGEETVLSRRMVISGELKFAHNGIDPHPPEDLIPRPSVSVKTNIRPIGPQFEKDRPGE